jgi:hypothetical protein
VSGACSTKGKEEESIQIFGRKARRKGPLGRPRSKRRMGSSGTLHRVVLVRTDVSEELSAVIITVTRIGEIGTLAVTSNRRTLLSASVAI